MASPLDWLQQMLGGTMGEMPQAAPNTGALDALRLAIGPSAFSQTQQYDAATRALIEEGRYGDATRQGLDNPMLGAWGGNIKGARAPRAAPAEPMFPQYAESYPPTGPAVELPKESGKGTYMSKVLTPEAEAFKQERNRIMKDMEKTGYEPYYKPEDRSYVDPANYPPANTRTRTEAVPKTFDTISNYMTQIGAPETMAALRAGYDKGIELGNAEHWYAMAQLERSYISELGEKAGRAAFLDEFALPMGATTSGNDPTANFLMAHFLEYQRKRGEPQTAHGYDLPYPVGGRRSGHTEPTSADGAVATEVGGNLRDYQLMRERGGYAGLGAGTPKMHNYDRSFLGDLSQPVMDDQMARGMLAHAGNAFADKARTSAFGLLEGPVHTLADELGVLPGNVQDVAWAGFKNAPGKPMISMVNDAIERTHRLTGMSRDDIVRRGLVRKEIPLYGLGGLGLGLGLSGQGGERDY